VTDAPCPEPPCQEPLRQELSLSKALNAGLRRALEQDDKVVLMGEDIGALGGVFRVTDGLAKDFGENRVMDTPLAESGIVGTAIGLAMRGYRPVCEIQFDGFVYPAFDQLVSQLAKLHYRTGGALRMPVTIRIPYGGGIGAIEHHSESPEAYFAHTAGLHVVTASNAADGYTMIQQAIASDDPVIFLEPKRRYWERTEVDLSPDAPAYPLHASRVLRAGRDLTLVAYGPTVATCLSAAEQAALDGVDVGVIDLRSLSPLDLDPVLEAVRASGRLIVVAEAPTSASVAASVAAEVSERAFYSLEAPVLQVTGFAVPYPASRHDGAYVPDVDRILTAVERSLAF
jgi:2-oxoisovalerate dehydrogenase E1 component beta subunit